MESQTDQPNFLRLYLVFEYDHEGPSLCDIYTTKERAETEAEDHNKKHYRGRGGRRGVEVWEVQE